MTLMYCKTEVENYREAKGKLYFSLLDYEFLPCAEMSYIFKSA
jgi:hypothetical protein